MRRRLTSILVVAAVVFNAIFAGPCAAGAAVCAPGGHEGWRPGAHTHAHAAAHASAWHGPVHDPDHAHGPDVPAHCHLCKADADGALTRAPTPRPVADALPPLRAAAAWPLPLGASRGGAAWRAGRHGTGPPPSLRTTHLLI